MACYQRMLPRLMAEEHQSLISVVMATNGREMKEDDRVRFLGELDDARGQTVARRPRAPKVTPGFLGRLQAAAGGV